MMATATATILPAEDFGAFWFMAAHSSAAKRPLRASFK